MICQNPNLIVIRNSTIGQNTEIREFCTINDSTLGSACLISERVSIKKCFLEDAVEVNAGSYLEKCNVSSRVMIAPNCSIVGVTHEFSQQGVSNIDVFNEITIQHGVWIGAGCIILHGVTIGPCSVIGAGSIVNKNIPPFHIYLGTPSNFRLEKLKDWRNRA
ncbi:MAG: acyltransferase [Candidatus Pacebacteria bacterium]|nr:acyltransferase [Candidatus Paceibacterota bacterium]